MGNIGGLYRNGGLKVEKVFPFAQEVVAEIFPTLLEVTLDDHGILFDWKHPDDKRAMPGGAMGWWQENGSKVGGKHIRCGDVGYWVMGMLSHNIALRIGPKVRLFDEGVGPTWAARPDFYPTVWHYSRDWGVQTSKTWVQTVYRQRLVWKTLYVPAGLDPKHLGFPEWAKGLLPLVPKEEPWFAELVEKYGE